MTETVAKMTLETWWFEGSSSRTWCNPPGCVERLWNETVMAKTSNASKRSLGEDWIAIVRKNGSPEFVAAFAKDPVLKASVNESNRSTTPMTGPAEADSPLEWKLFI